MKVGTKRVTESSHTDQLLYARLWEVLPDLARVPEAVEDAVAVLRDRSGVRFFDPCQYEKAIQTISAGWWLHDYPWAGAPSTAHTLLWCARYGSDVFRRFAATPRRMAGLQTSTFRTKRFDIDRMTRIAGRREAEIWQNLIYDRKTVSPELCDRYISAYPPELPKKNKRQPPGPRPPVKKHRRSK